MILSLAFGDTVYHGTIDLFTSTLIKGIDIKRGGKTVDFGQGFYATFNLNQAKSWARKRAESYNRTSFSSKDFAEPVILEYSFDLKKLVYLKGKIFDNPDIEWAKFIYHNRSKLNRVIHHHDYVYGLVADGKTNELIYELDNDTISLETFRKSIEFKGENDQISFHSKSAITSLTLISEVRKNGKRINVGKK